MLADGSPQSQASDDGPFSHWSYGRLRSRPARRSHREERPMIRDVADWLRGLGLEQYAPAFRANDIDGAILPELTTDDLIGLGVTSIGHRRKLLAAVSALRHDAAP